MSNDIQKIRETLLTKGWIQYAEATDYGFCLVGAHEEAIGWVDYNDLADAPAALAVAQAIWDLRQGYDENDDVWETITGWNDWTGRTFNQVMEVLDKAEIKLKEMEASKV